MELAKNPAPEGRGKVLADYPGYLVYDAIIPTAIFPGAGHEFLFDFHACNPDVLSYQQDSERNGQRQAFSDKGKK